LEINENLAIYHGHSKARFGLRCGAGSLAFSLFYAGNYQAGLFWKFLYRNEWNFEWSCKETIEQRTIFLE